MAINLNMDLSPFNDIVACGNDRMTMTQIIHHTDPALFKKQWLKSLSRKN